MQMKLVSVVIPIYNVKNYLDQCIQSIINQEYKNLEIILVDDGSNDGSGVICDKYAEIDKRIIAIHQKNQGHGQACNVGIKKAKGDYLCFCDGDDYFFPQTVRRLLEINEKNKTKITICTAYAFDNDNGNVSTDPYHTLIRVPKFRDNDTLNKKEILANASLLSVRHWDKIYDLNWVKNNKLYFPTKKTSYNDVPFHWLAISKVNKMSIIREQLYAYRMNRKGASCYSIKQKEYFDIRTLTVNILKEQKSELLNEFYKIFIIDMLWLKKVEKPIKKEFDQLLNKALKNKNIFPKTKEFIKKYFYQKSKKYLIKKKIKEILKIIFFN